MPEAALKYRLRKATFADAPAIEALIRDSVLRLQANEYSLEQRQGALGTVFGLDRLLIQDQTYFAVENEHGVLVACGGWSKRNTLFGSDNAPVKNDNFLDPAADAARIRAFFVHPDHARQGIGSRILEACEREAFQAGFRKLALGATLTGVPLYERYGFRETARIDVPLSNGSSLPIVEMGKPLLHAPHEKDEF